MLFLDRKTWKDKSGIYRIECIGNGKFYIGSAVNLYKRLSDHRQGLRKNKHHCRYLQNAYNKYGEDSFLVRVLFECNISEFKEKEVEQIEFYFNQGLAMNSTRDYQGSHGMIFTEERKRKISESNMGRKAHNKGKDMSEEQKAVLKEINLRERGKMINLYNMDQIFLQTICGVRECARFIGTDKRTVQKCLLGKLGTVKGFILTYHDEPINNKSINISNNNQRLSDMKSLIYNKIIMGEARISKSYAKTLGCDHNLIRRCMINYLIYFIARYNLLDYFNSID